MVIVCSDNGVGGREIKSLSCYRFRDLLNVRSCEAVMGSWSMGGKCSDLSQWKVGLDLSEQLLH